MLYGVDETGGTGTHIIFEITGAFPKTSVWTVFTKNERVTLGQIMWFGRWRCYAFFPDQFLVFEKTCLRDIADFCELQTKLQRVKSHAKKTKNITT